MRSIVGERERETSFRKREDIPFLSGCPSLEPHSSRQVDSHDCFVCVTWTIPVALLGSVRMTRENTDGRIMKMTRATTTALETWAASGSVTGGGACKMDWSEWEKATERQRWRLRGKNSAKRGNICRLRCEDLAIQFIRLIESVAWLCSRQCCYTQLGYETYF
jgi:hypothetical protein